MGEDIEDGVRAPQINVAASEDGERPECREGPNGAPCPSCASTRRPWFMPAWRCPECGHIKGQEPRYRDRYEAVMCESCFEQAELKSLRERRQRAWGTGPSQVDRILAGWQAGDRIAHHLASLTDDERDEVYARAPRSLREYMDKMEHPAGSR